MEQRFSTAGTCRPFYRDLKPKRLRTTVLKHSIFYNKVDLSQSTCVVIRTRSFSWNQVNRQHWKQIFFGIESEREKTISLSLQKLFDAIKTNIVECLHFPWLCRKKWVWNQIVIWSDTVLLYSKIKVISELLLFNTIHFVIQGGSVPEKSANTKTN